jgi:Txe/YoeB family toxin of Txe-Axe toxin-antitoxin module
MMAAMLNLQILNLLLKQTIDIEQSSKSQIAWLFVAEAIKDQWDSAQCLTNHQTFLTQIEKIGNIQLKYIVNQLQYDAVVQGVARLKALGLVEHTDPSQLAYEEKERTNAELSEMVVEQRQYDEVLSGHFGKLVLFNEAQYDFIHSLKSFEGFKNIEGVAGAGKTLLMVAAANELAKNTRAKIVYLVKQDAMKLQVKKQLKQPNIHVMTFTEFVEQFFNLDYVAGGAQGFWGQKYNAYFSEKQWVEKLGIEEIKEKGGKKLDVRRISASAILRQVFRTVIRYCHSRSKEIKPTHVDQSITSNSDRTMYFKYAAKMVELVFNDPSTPISPLMHAKYLQVNVWSRRVTTNQAMTDLLVDETQMLSASLVTLINFITGRYKAAFNQGSKNGIFFGDANQAPSFNSMWNDINGDQYALGFEKKEIHLSERLPKQLNGPLNSLLLATPNPRTIDCINSSDFHLTHNTVVPEHVDVFIAQDVWTLMHHVIKAHLSDMPYRLSMETAGLLNDVWDGLKNLHKDNEISHHLFNRYNNWQDFQSKMCDTIAQVAQHVDQQMFMIKILHDQAERGPLYALPTDVIGFEFRNVVLLDSEAELLSKDAKQVSKRLYLSVSRAKRSLVLPEGLLETIIG